MAQVVEGNNPVVQERSVSWGSVRDLLGTISIVILILLALWVFASMYKITIPGVPPIDTLFRPKNNAKSVAVDKLKLRVKPGNRAEVIYLLPRGTKVEMTGETYREPYGDIWARVSVRTMEGVEYGWVNERYLQ